MRYVIVLFVLLSACATQEEIAAQRRHEFAQQQAAREAYREQVYGQCRAYGFVDGSPEFRQCLMQVDQANQQRNAQMNAVILQQLLHENEQQRPLCSALAPGMSGYYRAQGRCR